MSLLGTIFGQTDPAADAAAAAREAKWQSALNGGSLPDFVTRRLSDAGTGKLPWISTITPAELLLSRNLGIRPITMVSGTCWYHFGYSWTNGHPEGWHIALNRMKQEAIAAGANAVVDVTLRTIATNVKDSMDFTVVGTAVRLDGLPPSTDPVIATVSAVEFVRLLSEGIVPTGVAIGADYAWLDPFLVGNPLAAEESVSQPLGTLGDFWRRIQRRAAQALREDTKRLGDGVLAHTHFGQMLRDGRESDRAAPFIGRYIILGTAVQCKAKDNVLGKIQPVIDMRDHLSPLNSERQQGHNAYPDYSDQKGAM